MLQALWPLFNQIPDAAISNQASSSPPLTQGKASPASSSLSGKLLGRAHLHRGRAGSTIPKAAFLHSRGSKPMGSHFRIGEFTTHFRLPILVVGLGCSLGILTHGHIGSVTQEGCDSNFSTSIRDALWMNQNLSGTFGFRRCARTAQSDFWQH